MVIQMQSFYVKGQVTMYSNLLQFTVNERSVGSWANQFSAF